VSLHIEDILQTMRSGQVQSDEEIAVFVRGVVSGAVSRPQAAAWLAWAFSRGLTNDETIVLTREMTASGATMTWPDGPTLIDKHSTGGVGDKVSLVLAPLWAELGFRVPMISGRGLGHTGGTLDKLESIPGYRCDLDSSRLREVLGDVSCFISGQTSELAPADRVLYGLRNETSTVESIPLIVGSILSKKLAEGVERLVLDVKTGSGAFMQTREDAFALAEALVRVARGSGVDCTALITAMDRPLGCGIGNRLEVIEAVKCLKGGGPSDLREIVVALSGDASAGSLLDSGAAFERFGRMVEAQGGDRAALDDFDKLEGAGCSARTVLAKRSGYVQKIDALAMGRAAFMLGAGRRRAEDPVDFGVGIQLHLKPGAAVAAGQPVLDIVHRDGFRLGEALRIIEDGLVLGEETLPSIPMVHGSV
jgi:pyrimidine-nucleoside phosphorylase